MDRLEVWRFIPRDAIPNNQNLAAFVGDAATQSGVECIHRGPAMALTKATGPIAVKVLLLGWLAPPTPAVIERRPLWSADADQLLHSFALRCAEAALGEARDAGANVPPLIWAAIAAKRRWLAGQIDATALTFARADAIRAAHEIGLPHYTVSALAATETLSWKAAAGVARERAATHQDYWYDTWNALNERLDTMLEKLHPVAS